MIALRKNFDEVPSDVRFQISWFVHSQHQTMGHS